MDRGSEESQSEEAYGGSRMRACGAGRGVTLGGRTPPPAPGTEHKELNVLV